MLVIHPHDSTTAMLTALYEGTDAHVISDFRSKDAMNHLLHQVAGGERIMLLGHGSDHGLYYRAFDTPGEKDKFIVGHPHTYHLRRHGSNIVAVWCHADLFARAERLHGLFSGMIISELSEAALYHVETTQEELDLENKKLAQRLRALLDEAVPLADIPKRMLALDDVHTPLTRFNYPHFYYL